MSGRLKTLVKRIAVYGTYKNTVHFKQRVWKKRKDGLRQRYWKKIKKATGKKARGRFEFQGKGRDLYKAIIQAHAIMPKGYVTVEAKKFVDRPENYGSEGIWIDKEIES